VRSRRYAVEQVVDLEQADAVLTVRNQLGQDPEVRRQAQLHGVPILVIKSDSLHQVQRGLQRLLLRRQPEGEAPLQVLPDDAAGAMEECRLAVEQVVLPRGCPVELLPRSARVRQIQAEQVRRYGLRCAEFGTGGELRLRVFPR
jgi:hypothetical protein